MYKYMYVILRGHLCLKLHVLLIITLFLGYSYMFCHWVQPTYMIQWHVRFFNIIIYRQMETTSEHAGDFGPHFCPNIFRHHVGRVEACSGVWKLVNKRPSWGLWVRFNAANLHFSNKAISELFRTKQFLSFKSIPNSRHFI